MAAPLPTGSNVFALPQAPQADPRNFAMDPMGALLTAQAGLHLGSELANLDNQQSNRELEAMQIKAAKAKNDLDQEMLAHARLHLPEVLGGALQQQLAGQAAATSASNLSGALSNASLAAGYPAAAAASQVAAANTATQGSTNVQLGLLADKSSGYAGSPAPVRANLDTLATTAGSLGSILDIKDPEKAGREFLNTKRTLMMMPATIEEAQKNKATLDPIFDRFPMFDRSTVQRDSGFGFKVYDPEKAHAAIASLARDNPIAGYGPSNPGFKEAYTSAAGIKQTISFLKGDVPGLLDSLGNPSVFQKTMDSMRDSNAQSLIKVAFNTAVATGVDPKTAARSALVDYIDKQYQSSTNDQETGRKLKNALIASDKDNNATLKQVIKTMAPTLEHEYDKVKSPYPDYLFEKLDEKPSSAKAEATQRRQSMQAATGAASGAPSAVAAAPGAPAASSTAYSDLIKSIRPDQTVYINGRPVKTFTDANGRVWAVPDQTSK